MDQAKKVRIWLEPPADRRTAWAIRYVNKDGKRERIRVGTSADDARQLFRAVVMALELPEALAGLKEAQALVSARLAKVEQLMSLNSQTVGNKLGACPTSTPHKGGDGQFVGSLWAGSAQKGDQSLNHTGEDCASKREGGHRGTGDK